MNETRKTVLVRVTGRVQGVSFRAWTRQEARRLGIAGWVRNEPDGAVTALLSGPDNAVDAMIRRLWNGPPAARVSGVEAEDRDPQDASTEFEIRS
jgi:acylphosphatase